MSILCNISKASCFKSYFNPKRVCFKKPASNYSSKQNKSPDEICGGSSKATKVSSEVCEICGFIHKTKTKASSDCKPIPKMLQCKPELPAECAPAEEELECKSSSDECVEEVEQKKSSKLGLILILVGLGVLATIGYKAYDRKPKD